MLNKIIALAIAAGFASLAFAEAAATSPASAPVLAGGAPAKTEPARTGEEKASTIKPNARVIQIKVGAAQADSKPDAVASTSK